MNDLEFLTFYKEELVAKEIQIFTLKGGEYSGDSNRFLNFEKLAEELGTHPLEIAWVYFSKHKDGIASFIRDKKVRSNEDVIGRLNDARNYLALIAGMIEKYRNLPDKHKWKLEKFNSVEEFYKENV
jgi:hypothetical protein